MSYGTMPRPPSFVLRIPSRAPAPASAAKPAVPRSHGLAPWFLSLFATVLLLGVIFCAAAARADLRDFAPDSATVTIASGTLLAADNQMRSVTLTNTGAYDVWICHLQQTAVVGKGFYLPVGSTLKFTGTDVPQNGLAAIANGGSTTVAIGKG